MRRLPIIRADLVKYPGLELAQLRIALESSGRFGRWAAKWVDRLSEKRGKSE